VTKSTILSTGPINGADTITIELIQPDSMPNSMPIVVRIVWPAAPTITTPARYLEVTSTAMQLLAIASTELARVKASRRRYPSAHRGMRGLAPVSGHPDDLANAAAELDRFIDDAGRLLTIQDGVDVEV
jgi:hypothetical protein